MEPAVWIIIGIVGLVAVLIPIAIKQLKKADAQIADWVQENGWERVTDHQVEDTLARSWFTPANRQISRPWTMQVLRGRWQDRDAMSFMYGYKTPHDEPQFHVVALTLPVSLPLVALAPKGPATAIYAPGPAPDLKLESAEFNRTWTVHGSDHRFVSDFLHPRMMQRLLRADAVVNGVELFVSGNQLFTMRRGRTELDRIDPSLRLLSDVAGLIPEHVLRSYGATR